MQPGIGRSIAQGFSAANRSWPAIGLFAAGFLGVGFLAILGIAMTQPPEEVLLPLAPEQQAAPGPKTAPAVTASTATQHAPATSGGAAGDAASPDTGKSDLFSQLSTAENKDLTGNAAVNGEAPAATGAEGLRREMERRMNLVRDWVGRAWPVLTLCLLLFLAANIWLIGGQIGYLAKRVAGSPAKLSDFWRSGARAFLPMAGGWLLAILALGALALAVVLIGLVFSALPSAVPDWLVAVFTFLLMVGIVAGVVWLVVRAAFWFIAIVVDGTGPMPSFKASFRASQGRWWLVAGLGVLLMAISFGISLPFAGLERIGNAVGSGAGQAVQTISNLLGFVASLFIGFAALAAYIRFYEDTKAAPAGSGAPQPAP